ncbi:hypothetical protein OF122_06445 [Pelagibacterium flavum]|uniref:Uncharacterized protein n=1 Tax=Pelagibacterium flavum TaxID=2984530 RepID=A0ABY6IW35_9HYPH|nr:hypothetical protein [Pelagibacterium sp. YIM 151497]UYQ73395.1 hypothetical protein OF122_06445 [Pelagibacterium sp. YIM 151497]
MTQTTTAYLPAVPSTIWTRYGAIYKARATDAFWRLYRIGKEDLRSVGIRCTMEGRDWMATYSPGVASPDQIERVLVRLDDAAMMNDAAIQREREARKEEKRRKAEAEEREQQEWIASHVDETRQLQAQAASLLKTYKAACSKAEEWPDLIGRFPLGRGAYWRLWDLVRATNKKIAKFERGEGFKRKRSPYANWPADVIAKGLRTLTAADSDHAELANDIGWSATDSSVGHYCTALLETDYETAVERARHFIGTYEKQLKMAGVL